jgi:hypothetical protein
MRRGLLPLLLILLALPAGAQARTPPDFFGVMADGPLFDASTDIDRELRLMRTSGVESIRVAFDWRVIEPVRGTTDFTLTDILVTRATRRRLVILPVVIWAPEWARRDPGQQASPPKPGPYAALVAKLARRYGKGGSFWKQNPSLPRVPLREWQIWNEPTVENFWTLQPWQEDYVTLLERTRKAVRREDAGARIVTAGLVYESWEALEKIYGAGGRGSFDVVALHPFTEKPANLLEIVERCRKVMRSNGDGRRPAFLSEVSWPSSLDKIGRRYGYETTERGMAQKIRRAYPRIVRARKRLRIERAYWYTWLTRETDPDYPFDYAGLRRVRRDGKIVSKPGLAAFRETVTSLRGQSPQ